MVMAKKSPTGTAANGHTKAAAVAANGSVEKIDQDDLLLEYEEENIFLFMPNLIGYARVVLAIASLYYMPLHPRTCSGLYSISCLLDAADGVAARRYNQSTTFGAVLDMVTDRCTTSCLLVFLASAFPRYSIIFQMVLSLDLASHYIHMYASLTAGGQSHKKVDEKHSWLLHLYYTNRTVLFSLCFLNEAFWIGLYLLSFSSPYISPSLLLPNDAPPTSAAQPASPAQPKPSLLFTSPWSAGALEMARANKMDSTVPWVLVAVSLLPMLLKQWISVVQLYKASKVLGELDVAARRKAGLVPLKNMNKKKRS